MTRLILVLALLGASALPAHAQVTVNSTEAAGHRSATSPLTWTFTNTAGTLLIVGVSTGGDDGTFTPPPTLTSVSYNGVLMTKLGTGQAGPAGSVLTQLFYLVNPATGAHSVSVVWANGAGNKAALGGAMSFANVNVLAPVGVEYKATGRSALVDSGPIPSTAGNLIASVTSAGSAIGTVVAPDLKTFVLDVNNNTANNNVAGTTWLSTGASHDVKWTIENDQWTIVAVEIHTASGVITPPAPLITSLTPAAGLIGAPVTIAGANFGATQGTSTVTFGGATATAIGWSATGITTTVPAGAVTGNVIVAVGGVSSNGSPFTVTAATQPPVLTSLTPGSGVVGTSVTIAGSNFGASQATSSVQVNGAVATPASWSATQIVVPVPATASSSGNVVVVVGGVSSNPLPFTLVVNTGPVITSLSPSTGAVGTQVMVTGSNLATPNVISFNGTAAVATPTSSLVTTVPAGATTGLLTVSVGGVLSNGMLFTVPGVAPAITQLVPASGLTGSTVTISGSNFGVSQGASTVQINGALATVTSWSASSVAAIVPSVTSGPVVVTVGGVASNGVTFTVTTAMAQATASWNASPPDPAAMASYTLAYGTTPGVHPTAVTLAGTVLSTTVTGLLVGTPYYFVVSATDTNNLTSGLSAEVAYTP